MPLERETDAMRPYSVEWARIVNARSRRSSSWDRRGGNRDRLCLTADETAVLLDVEGAGCVTHIWMTPASIEADYLRKLVLRMPSPRLRKWIRSWSAV